MPQVLEYVSQKAEMYEIERQLNGAPTFVECARDPQCALSAGHPLGSYARAARFESFLHGSPVAAWTRKVEIAEMEARRYQQLTRKFGGS